MGLAGGLAVLFKPNAAVYLPALLAWLALYGRSGTGALAGFFRVAVVAAVAALVPLGGMVVWFWARGVLPEAWVALVEFNRMYVSSGSVDLLDHVLAFSKAVWLRMKTDPLWLAGGMGACVVGSELVRRARLDPLAGLTTLWGAAAALAIFANGAWLFNSYFIQALPALAMLAAWLLMGASRADWLRRGAAWAAALLMLLLLVQRDYPGRVWRVAAADVAAMRGYTERRAHLERFGEYANRRGYSARANDELVSYLSSRTGRDDRIYVFGINAAGVYFEADRLAAHRFLRVNFFVPGELPHPDFRLDAVTRELAIARPAYLVFERLHSPTALGAAVDGLQEQVAVLRLLEAYRLEGQIEDFTLYRRLD
jgi:hypothetical protein